MYFRNWRMNRRLFVGAILLLGVLALVGAVVYGARWQPQPVQVEKVVPEDVFSD